MARVKSLTKPGWYGDGGTLYLVIAPGGSKQWVQRITIHSKRHDLGLGGFPLVSLAEARDKAFDNRRLARSGGDPLAEKRKAMMPTFREAAQKTYQANLRRWRSGKTAKNWKQGMEKHAFPILGDLSVDRIGREETLRVLAPIWSKRPEVARKLRQRMRATFQWCIAHGYIEHDPAGEAVSGALPSMRRVKTNYRALPYSEVAEALEVVGASRAAESSKLALWFLVLTAARSGEVRLATWDEIDLEARTWTIPAARMKAEAEHRVPLSDQALDVLHEAERLGDRTGLVFPSPRGKAMSDNTLSKLLRDQKVAAVPHGFRSSFRDWCAERGVDRQLAESALAHTVAGVEGAYFRSDLFERRRRLMAEWGAFIAGESGKVVALRA